MSLRSLVRSAIAGTATVALVATAGQAQVVNFTTTGFFTSAFAGCNGTATCTGGGFSLTFLPTAGVNLGTPTTTSLGGFSLSGTGSAAVAPGVVTFTLMISQTTPTIGAANYIGSVSGNVTTSGPGNISNLIWTPNQFVSIGPVNYQLIFDTIGPAANVGLNIPINDVRGINARITSSVIPEPATFVLMGSGLAALGFFGARRKKI